MTLSCPVPIENIKEMRSGSDGRYYREQFQLAAEMEDRWLTLIYILDGAYKTLHLVAPDKDTLQLWDITLRKLHSARMALMSGSGNVEARESLWEKQYWKGTDQTNDHKLDLTELGNLCRRLSINPSADTLSRLFKVC